ncbi:MAG: alpha-L-fucosidase [Prevotellaceae bacterium]|jgi:alpha-L-fucosidase|nr:alpha-L-fucosidase [Prevotellaceae bacterium]
MLNCVKKAILLSVFIFIGCLNVDAQVQNPAHRWFEDARFGLFVHFGPYSVLCDGEWVLNQRSLKIDDYKKLQHIFDPRFFDAAQWVRIAKSAGMKYITFTSRHHDGFSNWDTKQSEWNIMNTPYGKDLVRQLADECHKEGIKLVIYYSLLDWSRDDYSFTTGRTGQKTGRTEQKNWMSYIGFMKAQLTELLTNYGEIAGIWFDGEWDQLPEEKSERFSHDQSKVNWHFDEIYDLIHRLQPDCMIANNHHLPALPGEDYQAFEKDLPGETTGAGFGVHQTVSDKLPLETCETMNGSWGYRLSDNRFKSIKELIHLLVRSAGYGANLLLNVGPKPTGEIEESCMELLQVMGEWTNDYGKTIYGTRGGYIKPQPWGAVTQQGNKLYIHVFSAENNRLTLPCPYKIKSAEWLNIKTEKPLVWIQDKKSGDVTFTLADNLDEIDSIIEVTVK